MAIHEATRTLMAKIQTLDPMNATKIMGYIMIQEQGEQELIRLALLSDQDLLSYINQAKACLGLVTSNNNTTMIPNNLFPNNGFHSTEPSSPFSISNSRQYHQPMPYGSVLNDSSAYGAFPDGSVLNDSSAYGVFPDGSLMGPIMGSSVARGSMVPDSSGFEDFDVRPPCKYFARGFCRNGDRCKFYHGEPRLDLILYGRSSYFSKNHSGSSSSASRQIYMTFPANSTFTEDEVFNYFRKFGPVRDVRIPFQKERMFGFVSFVYPETVSHVLTAKKPHIICNSNVFVKPYKEKEELEDKKQLYQRGPENGGAPTCSRSSMFDPQQLNNLPVGPRMLNSQEMYWRRLMQEAEVNLALEGLQITDTNNHCNDHHFPCPSQLMNHHNVIVSSSSVVPDQEDLQVEAGDKNSESVVNEYPNTDVDGGQQCCPPNSYEALLPDNLYESPSKPAFSFKRSHGI